MPSLSGALQLLAVVGVTVVAFGLLIVIHEAGHFAVARLAGMRVERFSLGYGPVLWSTHRGDTEYCLSAARFGGYVRIAGMAPGEDVDPPDRTQYANQPAWRRFAVIVAGPAMNYLAALVLAAGLIAGYGFREPDPAGHRVGRRGTGPRRDLRLPFLRALLVRGGLHLDRRRGRRVQGSGVRRSMALALVSA